MKRLVVVGALVLAAAVATTGVVLARSGDGAPRVQVAEVTRGRVAEVVEAPGNVAARASATLSAPADGVVEAVLVQDGERVTSGQVLVRLRSDAAQQRLQAAQTAAANAAASGVRLPRTDLSALQDQLDAAAQSSFAAGRAAAAQLQDPQQRQAAEQSVADAERRYAVAAQAARAAVQQANAGIGSVETALNAVSGAQRTQAAAAVTAARATVDALTVRAPIDGVVTLGAQDAGGAAPGGGDLSSLISGLPGSAQGPASSLLEGATGPRTTATSLTAGQPVSAGAALLTVTDLSGLGVTAQVDETDVLQVQPGIAASVTLDAVPGATYTAAVSSVDVAPTASARGGVAYTVRLTLGEGRDGDGRVAPAPKPGMSAVVDLQVRSSADDALGVPASAVVRDGSRDAVLVLRGDRLSKRQVRLGAQGADRVEVVQGLAAGERVVTRDADRLRDGQRVQR